MSKLLLGIDVSKAKLSLALLQNDRFFNKDVDNNQAGFREILKLLSMKTSEKPEIYMEATGSYHEQLADFLVDHDFDVYYIHNERAEILCYNNGISRFIVGSCDEKL